MEVEILSDEMLRDYQEPEDSIGAIGLVRRLVKAVPERGRTGTHSALF